MWTESSFIHPSIHPFKHAGIYPFIVMCSRKSKLKTFRERALISIYTRKALSWSRSPFFGLVRAYGRVEKEVFNFCSDRWNNRRRIHSLSQHVRIHQRLYTRVHCGSFSYTLCNLTHCSRFNSNRLTQQQKQQQKKWSTCDKCWCRDYEVPPKYREHILSSSYRVCVCVCVSKLKWLKWTPSQKCLPFESSEFKFRNGHEDKY